MTQLLALVLLGPLYRLQFQACTILLFSFGVEYYCLVFIVEYEKKRQTLITNLAKKGLICVLSHNSDIPYVYHNPDQQGPGTSVLTGWLTVICGNALQSYTLHCSWIPYHQVEVAFQVKCNLNCFITAFSEFFTAFTIYLGKL